MSDGPQVNRDTEQKRPDLALTAMLASMSTVDAVVADLVQLGVPAHEVAVLDGPEGSSAFDLTGEHHGRWAQLVRTVKTSGGADGNLLTVYDEALSKGHALVLVPVPAASRRSDLVEVLRRHGATGISYFGGGGMESIPSRSPSS